MICQQWQCMTLTPPRHRHHQHCHTCHYLPSLRSASQTFCFTSSDFLHYSNHPCRHCHFRHLQSRNRRHKYLHLLHPCRHLHQLPPSHSSGLPLSLRSDSAIAAALTPPRPELAPLLGPQYSRSARLWTMFSASHHLRNLDFVTRGKTSCHPSPLQGLTDVLVPTL